MIKIVQLVRSYMQLKEKKAVRQHFLIQSFSFAFTDLSSTSMIQTNSLSGFNLLFFTAIIVPYMRTIFFQKHDQNSFLFFPRKKWRLCDWATKFFSLKLHYMQLRVFFFIQMRTCVFIVMFKIPFYASDSGSGSFDGRNT